MNEPHQEHQSARRQRLTDEYADFAAKREEAERVEAVDYGQAGLREHLWLNGRLGEVYDRRFSFRRIEGTYLRIEVTDNESGQSQTWGLGQWNFIEAWINERMQENVVRTEIEDAGRCVPPPLGLPVIVDVQDVPDRSTGVRS